MGRNWRRCRYMFRK